MTRTSNHLRAARAIVEKGWTQGQYARRADGERTGLHESDAVCWCASAALEIGTKTSWHSPSTAAHLIFREVVGESIPDWNDAPSRTKEDVLFAFDRAISIAEIYAESALELVEPKS